MRILMLSFALIFVVGCNTPQSICNATLDSLNEMWARCGYPYTIELQTWEGEPLTCHQVNAVDDPGLLLNHCIPWADNISCEELSLNPTALDPSCDLSRLQYIP